jgi:caffeoyl-CoA O-methyltransferase
MSTVSAAEARILDVIRDMERGSLGMSVPEEDARLLRVLAESLNAQHVVEIGTFKGYSGLWVALALRRTGGRLTTFEVDARTATGARRRFDEAGIVDIVHLVVGDAHDALKNLEGPIDMAFIDADKQGYLSYLKALRPLVRPGGLILAHNVHSPRPDPRFIEAITEDPDLDTAFVNMDGAGMSITVKRL